MKTNNFYLGTHQPGWLSRANVPLFVSDRRLRGYKTMPIAAAPWACDSGGFTELQMYGMWTVTPKEYVQRLRRYSDEVGQMDWAAPQDLMCEDIIINGGWLNGRYFVGTHLSVPEHQRLTVLNWAELRDLAAIYAPRVRIIRVSQGLTPDDHLRMIDLYRDLIGEDLTDGERVGIGSICRRQGTKEAGQIIATLKAAGVRKQHLFGFKTKGYTDHGHLLLDEDDDTGDSQAWSDTARKMRRPALPRCVEAGRHINCANCMPYALIWREQVLAKIRGSRVTTARAAA